MWPHREPEWNSDTTARFTVIVWTTVALVLLALFASCGMGDRVEGADIVPAWDPRVGGRVWLSPAELLSKYKAGSVNLVRGVKYDMVAPDGVDVRVVPDAAVNEHLAHGYKFATREETARAVMINSPRTASDVDCFDPGIHGDWTIYPCPIQVPIVRCFANAGRLADVGGVIGCVHSELTRMLAVARRWLTDPAYLIMLLVPASAVIVVYRSLRRRQKGAGAFRHTAGRVYWIATGLLLVVVLTVASALQLLAWEHRIERALARRREGPSALEADSRAKDAVERSAGQPE